MPRNGSGTYSLPSGNPVVSGTTISSGWANPTLSDIASALTASLAVDGQTTPTANLPMGNFRHLNVANAQNANEYASVAQIQTAGLTILGVSAGLISTTQAITTTQTITGGNLATGGNVTATGNVAVTGTVTAANVTITSDERIKGEWEDLAPDFLERLSGVRIGTYRRIDTDSDARHVGVTAQSLREVLPEAVLEGATGILSVAYGNAALVACVALAKEVRALQSELAEVRHLSGL